MDYLKVTDYGTIKGTLDFKEMPIEKFLRKIERNINKEYPKITNNYSLNIGYKTIVSKDENAEDYYCITINEETYYLDISSSGKFYPILKDNLSRLNKISNDNLARTKIINCYEQSGDLDIGNNSNKLIIYLDSLKKYGKKYTIEKILYILRALLGPTGVVSCFFMAVISYDILPWMLGIIISFILLTSSFIDLTEGESIISIKSFKMSKLIKLKIKEVTKRLNKVNDINSKLDALENDTIVKRDIYKDAMINYMNSIMICINKLNTYDRHKKLIELKVILEEYTSRCQNLKNNTNGLTLENGERVIVTDILDKLTTMEMEIAELIRRDDEKKKITSESDILMEHIDEYIRVIEHDEAKLNINGKKKIKHMVKKGGV